MELGRTERKLEAITDEGLFEKLAAAVLRDADPTYRALIHPGVNSQGRTVKSPVDGIAFVPGAKPPQMVIVHHTTTAQEGLTNKWLHDPAIVKPRGARHTAPEGDVRKAIAITAAQRNTEPDLAVTLVLTTNREPDQKAIRQTHALAASAGIDVDFWTRSRLAHFLDTDAQGQWLRRIYLGDEPERLSRPFLLYLAQKSLAGFPLHDLPRLWIARTLDETLAGIILLGTSFLVAQSGLGKSTAAYKLLADHIASGGVGLVLPDAAIAGALTLDGAIEATLRELHPNLGPGAGSDAIAVCNPDDPLLLVVEDINISGQAASLAEKILSWDRRADRDEERAPRPYRLICPIWPEVLNALHDRSRVAIARHAVFAGSFEPREGRLAVQRRAQEAGVSLSDMDAEEITATLGHDPLLIALHDPHKKATSTTVIGDFVEGQIVRLSAARHEHPAAKYRIALRAYASAVLCRRKLDPEWAELESWGELTDSDRLLLGHMAQAGEILRLTGVAANQRIAYRHDRVRDWLLIDAAVDLERHNRLPAEVLTDPYFAEVIAGVLASTALTNQFVQEVRTKNPLALFAALRLLRIGSTAYQQVVQAIDAWLDDPKSMSPALSQLRWHAVSMLAETEGPDVVRLVIRMQDRSWASMRARLRNGDLMGGVELCCRVEPGSIAPWRDIQLEHARRRFGNNLIGKTVELLQRPDLAEATRVGLLRMAGHMADVALAPAVETSWDIDAQREAHLGDYLLSFAECCGDDPERFLKPVCDAWAALPAERAENNVPSPRDNLAAHGVRWAFGQWVPRSAVPYFIKRAENISLRWPITYMLSEIDDPVSILFIVEESAAMQRRSEASGSFSPFAHGLASNWWRLQERGMSMSNATRAVLQRLWLDPGAEKQVRRQAFQLWAATHRSTDLPLLRRSDLPKDLGGEILRQRLVRSDQTAVPALLQRITAADEDVDWWWSYMKYVWSDALLPVLDSQLERRAGTVEPNWQHGGNNDYMIADLLMRVLPTDAEKLLSRHWTSLRYV
jgi:hypothetical protein